MNINIKCTNGEKYNINSEASNNILDVKEKIFTLSSIPTQQQRLIYKGNVLKDERTLESYNIEEGNTIILVRGSRIEPSTSSNIPATATSVPQPNQPTQPQTSVPLNDNSGLGNVVGLNGLNIAGLGPLGGMANNPGMQQMLQNPELMEQMMNSPMMDSILNNPELMQSMMQSNPQMQQLMQSNPEVAQLFNDPALMRQTMQMARNPRMMQEMLRSTDRQMSNIEAHPEGFNALRRMYHQVQEPMTNAMLGNQTNADLARQNVSNSPATESINNASPLPNPWTNTTNINPNTNANPMGQFGLGGLGIGAGGINAIGMNPEQLQAQLNNPMVQTMMNQMLQNPQFMQSMINSNPMLSQMSAQNPMMQQMLQNPEMLRMSMNMMQGMTNNNNISANTNPPTSNPILNASNLNVPFLNPLQGFPPQNSNQPNQNSGNTNAPFDLSRMMAMMQGMNVNSGGVNAPAFNSAPPVSNEVYEQRYANQLQQLADMGFPNRASNLQALISTGGDVTTAINILLAS